MNFMSAKLDFKDLNAQTYNLWVNCLICNKLCELYHWVKDTHEFSLCQN